MRFDAGNNRFDPSDVDGAPIDKLDDILDVAAEVLLDYGGEGSTRIQRLARYVALNLGGEPYGIATAAEMIKMRSTPTGARADALQMVVALLRAIELSETESE